jgi:hypothetical protein
MEQITETTNSKPFDQKAVDLLLSAMAEMRRTARLLDLIVYSDKTFDYHNHHSRVGCDNKADAIEKLLRENGYSELIDDVSNEVLDTRKQDLIAKLMALKTSDPAEGHPKADWLLIEYIDDPEVKAAYNGIPKWYE